MGIDGMRVGGGRCPPLIVAGLIVACFLLVCNWWSLSTENTELLRQIDGLSQQLKISAEQRDQCITLRGKLEQRYKTAEEEVTTLHKQLGQERESSKSKDTDLTMCKIDVESLKKSLSTVETLRLEKQAINEQLERKKEDIKKLQEELGKVQDELSSLKLSQDLTGNKKTPAVESQAAAETIMTNETQNGGNQEEQNIRDGDGSQLQSDENETDAPEDNGAAQESLRDQVLHPEVSDPDTKANGS